MTTERSTDLVTSGITPLDERVGGLARGGTYLVVGPPGPAKMVATFQFLAEGLRNGESGLLVANGDARGVLDVADAWGFSLEDAWQDGRLQILGFRDDFELRAMRSIEPEEVLDELDEMTEGEPARIVVDPGSLFLSGGARTILGTAFMTWARRQEGTVLATFSVDGDATALPSAADWLVSAATGRLTLQPRTGSLYQVTVAKSMPEPGERDETVTVELKAGEGLVEAQAFPARRGADRSGVDHGRLLLVSLDADHSADLRTWAGQAFNTDVETEPLGAVSKIQQDTAYGCVLVHAPRTKVREAIQACRAIRPLTRAAIVFASDDVIRSTDRIHVLEAGADDCLSGGLDFRELGLRIRQALATGAKPMVADADTTSASIEIPEGADEGRVDREVFAREVGRRADLPDLSFFSLVRASSGTLSPADLEQHLADLVRSEDGDLVSAGADHCLALLQGAREAQAEAFLRRLRSTFAEADLAASDLALTVLTHPKDEDAIGALLGESVGQPG